MSSDLTLIDKFVTTFEKLDELSTWSKDDPLLFGEFNEDEFNEWRPIRVETDHSALESIYETLPARFPALYEQLVLSYRWAEVDLGLFRLLANPPGPTLAGLTDEIYRDPGMLETLILNKCLQFGQGPDADYDAVCFDWSRRRPDGDCPIVQIDHEEILCRRRFKIVGELAPSFRELMQRIIDTAAI
ncbi:MAG: hypothetical protein ABIP75_17620 [Pyrinomonadaceae bacterium]